MRLAFAFVGLLFLSCSDSSDEPERTPCEHVRDHLVSLRLAEIDAATGVDREAHRRAMAQSLGGEFVDRCSSSLSDDQITCVLAANNSTDAAACAR